MHVVAQVLLDLFTHLGIIVSYINSPLFGCHSYQFLIGEVSECLNVLMSSCPTSPLEKSGDWVISSKVSVAEARFCFTKSWEQQGVTCADVIAA